MPNKVDIIVDSNALSHLASISIALNKEMPHKWLWKLFNVYICKSIKDEFLTNIDKAPANSKAIGKVLVKNKSAVITASHTDTLERKWLSGHYYKKTLAKSDQGERHMVCVSAEMVYLALKGRLIIVTDDQTAVEGFITNVLNDNKFADVWTTLDLIIYMFYSFKEVSEDFAKDAVRDIGSMTSYSIKKYKRAGGQSDAETRLLIVKDYHNRIHNIKRIRTLIAR
ncbi:hypothetical protein D9M68_463440 [compost metagenome]